MVAGVWTRVGYSYLRKICTRILNFGTGMESESENVTPTTSGGYGSWMLYSPLRRESALLCRAGVKIFGKQDPDPNACFKFGSRSVFALKSKKGLGKMRFLVAEVVFEVEIKWISQNWKSFRSGFENFRIGVWKNDLTPVRPEATSQWCAESKIFDPDSTLLSLNILRLRSDFEIFVGFSLWLLL